MDTPLNLNLTSEMAAHKSVESRAKRFIDVIGALVGLVITGIALLPIAIAIKLDSRGPIFFCQPRCGLYGKPFGLWKFRSMEKGADRIKHLIQNEAQGQIFKNAQDPRITRVGRFLRRTSLDELPQFWNVLIGNMSLVGTRPPTFDEVRKYKPHHWRRLTVKPGMTGLWQVNGRSKVSDFEKIVDMDMEYQRCWSNSYDLKILLRTVIVVLQQNGSH